MNKLHLWITTTAGILLTSAAVAAAPGGLHGRRLLDQAAVSPSQARQTALYARPGVITDQVLEKAKGGSGLRYAFDVKNGRGLFVVGVDANTGTILQNRPARAESRWPEEV